MNTPGAAAQAGAAGRHPLLGFDYGTRHIGVATGEPVTGTTRPLLTLQSHAAVPPWRRIDELLAEWQPQALVVGLPLAEDGSEQPMSGRARRFADQLATRFALPVHLCDERHSSREAARRFAQARAAGRKRRRDASKLDAMAAAVILETWLASHRQSAGSAAQ